MSGIIIAVNTPGLALPDDYPHLLAELKAQIRCAQWTAVRVVNTSLIDLYWGIGKAILDRQEAEGWGTRVIDRLSDDLRAAYPDMSGLSRSNIKYMRQMAAVWPEPAIVQQPVGQLPWGHVTVDEGNLDVAASLAVLAGIAASDALCGKVLGHDSQGLAGHSTTGLAGDNLACYTICCMFVE